MHSHWLKLQRAQDLQTKRKRKVRESRGKKDRGKRIPEGEREEERGERGERDAVGDSEISQLGYL